MSESTQGLRRPQRSDISADLLEILRDPAAVQEPDKYGDDPGRLELVHNSWLVSKDTGYKYPIKDGIPVMLIEEGERWKDTPIEALPVPPESIAPTGSQSPIGSQSALRSTSGPQDLFVGGGDSRGVSPIILAGGLVVGFVAFFALWRWLTRSKD